MTSSYKHILLLMTPGHMHAWEAVRGVCRYAKAHRWRFSLANQSTSTAQEIKDQHIDGIIGLIHTPEQIEMVCDMNLPAVNLTRGKQVGRIPSMLVNDYRCGVMAAEYFLSRGFSHFTYVGSTDPNRTFSYERRRGFVERLAQESSAHFHEMPTQLVLEGEQHVTDSDWVRNLPRPIAVFSMFDTVGARFLDLCREEQLRVPEEVAVLGVHNAQITCEMASPPLSSIDTASEQRGFLAAQMLDRQFQGDRDPSRVVELPPVGVVSRQSTDIVAVDDPLVAEAVRYIREHVDEGIDVSQLVSALAVSRRLLERKFKATLGRSPLNEIHRLRVSRALDLLASTSMSVAAVARRVGYGRQDRMAKALRESVGYTPSEYRAMFYDIEGDGETSG